MAAETNGDIIWKRSDSASDHDEVWDDTALIEAYDRAVNQVKDEIEQRNSNSGNAKKKGRNRKPKTLWKVGDYCQAAFSEDGIRYEAYIKEVNQAGTSCLVQYIGYGNEEIVPMSDLSQSLGKTARAQQELKAGSSAQGEAAAKKDGTSETSSQISFSQNKGHSKRHRRWRYPSRSSSVQQAPTHPSSHSNMPGPPGELLSWLRTVVPPQMPSDSKAQAFPSGCFHSGHSCQSGPSHQQPQQCSHDHYQHYSAPHIPPPPFPLDHNIVDNEEALAAMLMSWYMSGYHTGFYQALQQGKSSKHGSGSCCMHTK